MSQGLARSYSPDRVEISLGLPSLAGQTVPIEVPDGLALPHIVDGRAGDGFLTIAREVPVNSKVTGADGEVIRVRSRNKSGTITIVTQLSSSTNTVLSALLAADEQIDGAEFYFPVTVRDRDDNTSLYEAAQCWVQGWPERADGANPGNLTWVIECAVLDMFHGGRGVTA